MVSRTTIKFMYSLYFFFLSIVFLPVSIAGNFVKDSSLPQMSALDEVLMRGTCLLLGAIFAYAGWVAARHRRAEERGARIWALSACVVSTLIFGTIPFLYLAKEGPAAFWQALAFFGVPQAIGIGGLFVFRQGRQRQSQGKTETDRL